MTNHIKTEIETSTPSARLRACVDRIDLENPITREEVATIAKSFGYWTHVGGRHVGIMKNEARLAIITHPTAEDFN